MKDQNKRNTVDLNLINHGTNGMTNRLYIHRNTWIFSNRIANRIKIRNKNRLLVIDLNPKNRIKFEL